MWIRKFSYSAALQPLRLVTFSEGWTVFCLGALREFFVRFSQTFLPFAREVVGRKGVGCENVSGLPTQREEGAYGAGVTFNNRTGD